MWTAKHRPYRAANRPNGPQKLLLTRIWGAGSVIKSLPVNDGVQLGGKKKKSSLVLGHEIGWTAALHHLWRNKLWESCVSWAPLIEGTSRLNPACWSLSFTLCLIRIVTFFNVARSASRGPLTQNKLNYSYVMLAADWLYFWRWYLSQLNAAYQTWRVSGFSSSSLWYVKNIITDYTAETKWHM